MVEITKKITRIGLSRKRLSKMTEEELKFNMDIIKKELKDRNNMHEGLSVLFS